MAIFAGVTQQEVVNYTQLAAKGIRDALVQAKDVHDWLSGYAQQDLVNLGIASADAEDILSAVADAYALYQIYYTGQAPGTYPQVTSPYNYSASQEVVIGPLQ